MGSSQPGGVTERGRGRRATHLLGDHFLKVGRRTVPLLLAHEHPECLRGSHLSVAGSVDIAVSYLS